MLQWVLGASAALPLLGALLREASAASPRMDACGTKPDLLQEQALRSRKAVAIRRRRAFPDVGCELKSSPYTTTSPRTLHEARAAPHSTTQGASAKMAAAVQQAPYLGPSSSTNEWIETQAEDERFLPTFQDDASLITEGLWLGSEANVRDLAWVKVEKIQRIVTIMPYEVDPCDGGNVSENLKDWFRANVQVLFLDARDTPTQLV